LYEYANLISAPKLRAQTGNYFKTGSEEIIDIRENKKQGNEQNYTTGILIIYTNKEMRPTIPNTDIPSLIDFSV
jgi:hypothetical protein